MSHTESIEISEVVQEEIDQISGTIPVTPFYGEDGSVLLLANDGTYIISVEPPDPKFNKGNPTSHSAYLAAVPIEDIVSAREDTYTSDNCEEIKGWSSGWEC
jgi:hypothetical protein